MAQLNYGITLIVIVAMSCTYGHAMHTEDHKDSVAQTTVASILTQIADAVDVVTKGNQANEWENSIDLLKKIFVQEKKPHTNLEIFRDKSGYIEHNYAKNQYPPSLSNLITDPNLIFVIKHNSTKISIETTEQNLFKPKNGDNYYLEPNTLSLVKTIISQFIKQPENELPENEKLEISYSKNLENFEKILSTSSSNNVFICLQKEQLIPALFCSYFLSCIIQYIRNQIKQTQTNQLSEKATLNEGDNTVKSSWQGNAIETKSLPEGEKSCTVSAKKCEQPMHLDTLNVNTASEHPFQQVNQTKPDKASSNKEESQEPQPTPQIRKTGDATATDKLYKKNVSDKKEEKKSNQEKRSFRDIILIGSCGSVILCLSAILYWYYKKYIVNIH